MTDALKKKAAEKAVEEIQSHMVIGLGTGSTVYFALKKIGERVRQGLIIRAIPTSEQSRIIALQEGISLTDFSQVTELDLTIDGADEVDPELRMIKGGGGALLREKIVAGASKRVIVVADGAKRVKQLGKFPLPVEVIPFGWQVVAKKIETFGVKPTLRQKGEQIFVTDSGNYILDCPFGVIEKAEELEIRLNMIPGVVENGLFNGLATEVILGQEKQLDLYKRQ